MDAKVEYCDSVRLDAILCDSVRLMLGVCTPAEAADAGHVLPGIPGESLKATSQYSDRNNSDMTPFLIIAAQVGRHGTNYAPCQGRLAVRAHTVTCHPLVTH